MGWDAHPVVYSPAPTISALTGMVIDRGCRGLGSRLRARGFELLAVQPLKPEASRIQKAIKGR